ncbi:hypothetical protein [Acidithiobacillus albertensis]|uniref:hypothetical protein n=1 Tax=Acidithiobacillus albertensis TaxID=119978 RepID=UPI001C07AD82|nr:hypothetical protein [Acidithiobacillus albertensis]MBU2742410.1 hypothetical protein [Acidithiobacillus albertensis]
MFKKTVLTMAMLAAIGISAAAMADTGHINPILGANSEIGIGFLDTQSNYSENIVSPYGSDVENGMMPGFTLFGKDTFNAFGVRHWYASISYARTSGQTTYGYGTFNESAQHSTNDLQTKFGKTFFLNANNAITPYLFGGYRSWHRVVPGAVSSPENYHNAYIGLGAKYQMVVTRRLVLSANGGVGEVVGGGLAGNMSNYDQYFNVPSTDDLTLAPRPYYTMGVGADYRVTTRLHLLATAQYTDFMYGGSQWKYFQGDQPSTQGYEIGFREPSSQTSNLSVGLAMAYQFG